MENNTENHAEILKAIDGVHKKVDASIAGVQKNLDASIAGVSKKLDESIAGVYKKIDEVQEQVGDILQAVGHFSDETEHRFRGIEEKLVDLPKMKEIREDQKKILKLLEKDVRRTKKYNAEFAANLSAHARFNVRIKTLEKRTA